MSLPKRALQLLLSGAGFVLCAVGLMFAAGIAEWTPGQIPETVIPLFFLVVVGVAAGVATWVARTLERRWRSSPEAPETAPKSRVRRAVAAGYVLTAVFGVPATLSQQHSWAVGEYKRLRASGSAAVWEAHPYIQSYGAIPIVPGIVLSYHEYQLAGKYGFGGFELSLWYGAGVKTMGVLPIWLS